MPRIQSRPFGPFGQRGVSVIEIMISLVLGLVLVVGVTNMAVGSRKTSLLEQNLADIQTTGRIALHVIGKELRKAGYRRDPELALVDAFPADAGPTWVEVRPFDDAGSIVGKSIKSGWGQRGFTVRYQGSGEAWDTNCKNEAIAAGATAWSTLFTNGGKLHCMTSASAASILVLEGIEELAVSFGVDNDGDSFADEYKDASGVTDWSRITSVNVQVRVVSAQDNLADSPQPYVNFSGAVVTPSDRRVRRSYATVVALRNVLP